MNINYKYKILKYEPSAAVALVEYTPNDPNQPELTPLAEWVPIYTSMTEEQIKYAIMTQAPQRRWELQLMGPSVVIAELMEKEFTVNASISPEDLIPHQTQDAVTLFDKYSDNWVVSMKQMRLALLQAGMLDDMISVINLIENNTTRLEALIQWEFDTTIAISNSLIKLLQNHMQLTDDQIRQLFVDASKL